MKLALPYKVKHYYKIMLILITIDNIDRRGKSRLWTKCATIERNMFHTVSLTPDNSFSGTPTNESPQKTEPHAAVRNYTLSIIIIILFEIARGEFRDTARCSARAIK